MVRYKEFSLISPQTCYLDNVSTLKTTSIVSDNSVYDVVGATSKNNGNVGFCNQNDLLIDGNCICLIKTGEGSVGEAVYKFGKFIPSNNVAVIRSKYLNKNIGLYFVTAINKNADRYNYGYIRNEKRILKEKITLPVDSDGEPDYEFMEKYIKERENKFKEQYKEHIKNNVNDFKEIELNKEWKEFFISEIFEKIQRGKRLIKEHQKEGKLPYVSSTASNNGVDNFIGNEIGVRKYDNCLSLANSGSVGACFYEPYEFIASDHVTHLKGNYSKYAYLFMSCMLNRLSEKYNFNREINDTRIKREKIFLPVNSKTEPDYEFMHNYMLYLEQKKILEYLEYINE